MTTTLIVSIVGKDRPGLVETLANTVAEHKGNWLQSRMAIMGGKFAGIVEVALPQGQVESFNAALAGLKAEGISARSEAGLAESTAEFRPLVLDLVGQDHPGIVQEISSTLAACGVNVNSLDSELRDASMAGGELFYCRVQLCVPMDADDEQIRASLENLANELMVDIEFNNEDPL